MQREKKSSKREMEMWKCGNVEMWKCGNVEIIQCTSSNSQEKTN